MKDRLSRIKPVQMEDCVIQHSHDQDIYDALRYNYANMIDESFNQYEETEYLSGEIERVIYNDPATIVFWTDGRKTVVKKSEDDVWDPEKGLAMAIVKYFFGSTSFLKDYIYDEEEEDTTVPKVIAANINKSFEKLAKSLINTAKIYEGGDKDGRRK